MLCMRIHLGMYIFLCDNWTKTIVFAKMQIIGYILQSIFIWTILKVIDAKVW